MSITASHAQGDNFDTSGASSQSLHVLATDSPLSITTTSTVTTSTDGHLTTNTLITVVPNPSQPVSSSSSKPSKYGAVIGGAIGAAFAVILALLILVFIRRRRKARALVDLLEKNHNHQEIFTGEPSVSSNTTAVTPFQLPTTSATSQQMMLNSHNKVDMDPLSTGGDAPNPFADSAVSPVAHIPSTPTGNNDLPHELIDRIAERVAEILRFGSHGAGGRSTAQLDGEGQGRHEIVSDASHSNSLAPSSTAPPTYATEEE